MPRHAAVGCEPIFIEVPSEMKQALVSLSERNQRGLKQECIHAFERHLAAPPILIVQTPPTPASELVVQAEGGTPLKRPRGRPTKNAHVRRKDP